MSHRRQLKQQGVSLNSRGWIEREKHLPLEEAKRDARARNGAVERLKKELNTLLHELQVSWAKIPPSFTVDREAVRLHFRYSMFREWPARQILEKEGKLKPTDVYFGDELDKSRYQPGLMEHAVTKWSEAMVANDEGKSWRSNLTRIHNHLNLLDHIVKYNQLDSGGQREAFLDIQQRLKSRSVYTSYSLMLCKAFSVVEASGFDSSLVKMVDDHTDLVDDLWEEAMEEKPPLKPNPEMLKVLRGYDSTLVPQK